MRAANFSNPRPKALFFFGTHSILLLARSGVALCETKNKRFCLDCRGFLFPIKRNEISHTSRSSWKVSQKGASFKCLSRNFFWVCGWELPSLWWWMKTLCGRISRLSRIYTTHLSHAVDWEWQTKSVHPCCVLCSFQSENYDAPHFHQYFETHAWKAPWCVVAYKSAAPPTALQIFRVREQEMLWLYFWEVSATLFNWNRTAGAFNLGRDSVKFARSFKLCQKVCISSHTFHGLMFWINSTHFMSHLNLLHKKWNRKTE